jgi:hypothetical protein
MNSPHHFLVGRNIDCAKQSDHKQADLAQTFLQSQSDISELHCHNLSQASGIQSGDRQIIGPPPIE